MKEQTPGQWIYTMRTLNNLTIENVRKASGLSKGQISKLENDKNHNPTIKTIFQISKGLNCSPDRVFNAFWKNGKNL